MPLVRDRPEVREPFPQTKRIMVLLLAYTTRHRPIPAHILAPYGPAKINHQEGRQPVESRPTPNQSTFEYEGITIHREDTLNLRRLHHLATQTIVGRTEGEYEGKAAAIKHEWHTILHARAKFFTSGWLRIDIGDYGIYRAQPNIYYRKYPRRELRVDSRVLTALLNAVWYAQFVANNHVGADDHDDAGDSAVVEMHVAAPCHPLVFRLVEAMGDFLKRLDGQKLNGNVLERRLRDSVWMSDPYQELDRLCERPQGIWIFASFLEDMILREFVRMNAKPDGEAEEGPAGTSSRGG